MSLTRRRFISISAAAAVGFYDISAHAEPSAWQGTALGAHAKLHIGGVSRGEGDRLITLARAEIERLENIFSIYRNDSAISQLNRTGFLTLPPPEMIELLSMARTIHVSTAGRFDPTIQPLWALYAEKDGRPSLREIEKVRRFVGMSKVQVSVAAVKFNKHGMALTLNGIAQGYITDRVVSLLRAEGLKNAVVNLGEISAMGHDMTGDPWKIGVAEFGDEQPDEYVSLANGSIATSAPLGTTFDGEASHIIDPSNGKAVRSVWRSVSVMHRSAAVADGLSTAMIMMNEKQLRHMVVNSQTKVIARNNNGRTVRL